MGPSADEKRRALAAAEQSAATASTLQKLLAPAVAEAAALAEQRRKLGDLNMVALCRSSELRLPDGVTDLIKHTGAETLSELVALSEDTVDMIFQHAGKGNVDFNVQLELSGARSRLKMF